MKILCSFDTSSKKLFKGIGGVFAFFLTISVAQANPEFNNVAAGNASVTQTQTTTTVNQTSQSAVINWNSFNIGKGESTHFQQPQGGVAYNRINPSQGASSIYGSLTATGQIILSNPAGIYFGPNAYVNVGGLIATTANMSDEDFMNGIYQFAKVNGYNGSIINDGVIFAAQHGLVALVAPGVVNNGVIRAQLGHVVLASGEAFTVSFSNDGLINFKIDTATSTSGIDRHGNQLRNGVSNTGKIIANGGTVLLTAKSAQGILDNIINLEGVVQVRSVGMNKGELILSADNNHGTVRVAAKINASGKQANQVGGNVSITGHNILIDNPTVINVSGHSGGGKVFIGGNYQGKGPLANAHATVIGPNVRLIADAILQGNGGTVIVWSDHATKVYGSISARGGALSGNGGFIETSGHQYLDVSGIKINTTAANGELGTWLLDPENVYITAAATSGGSFNSSNPNIFTPTSDNANVSTTDIVNNLATANVIITTGATGSQDGDIYVNAPITWNSANSLTLSAYRDVVLNADITNTGGANVTLRADNTGTGIGTVCGAGSLFCGGAATGIVTLSGGSGVVSVYYNAASFGTPDTIYTGGTAPIAYMLVNNAIDFQNINSYLSENFALSRDVDLVGITNFTPINNFGGRLDGQNYTLSNLTINDTGSNSVFGLFGNVSNATISNLTLDEISITLTGNNNVTGGLVANSYNNTIINNVHVTGNIDISGDVDTQTTGGLIGYADNNAVVSNVSSAVTLNISVDAISPGGYAAVGGVIGSFSGSLTNAVFSGCACFITTTNEGNVDLGGIVGNSNGATYSNINSSADISLNSDLSNATENIGGLIGNHNNTSNSYTIDNASSTGDILVTGNSVAGYRHIGGVVGVMSANISNATSSGTITVTSDISTSPVFNVINNNYSTGGQSIGGLIGSMNYNPGFDTVLNSTSTRDISVNGDVTGLFGFGSNINIGGLVGANSGHIVSTGIVGNTASGTIAYVGNMSANSGVNIGGLIGNSFSNDAAPNYQVLNVNVNTTITVTGDSTGGYANIGGLAGGFTGNTNNVTSTGSITIDSNLSTINQSIYNQNTMSYQNENTNAYLSLGGFIGSANSVPLNQLINNATSSTAVTFNGNVSGVTNSGSNITIGGFAGSGRSNISNSTSSGAVSVNTDISNFAGSNIGGFIGNHSNYFDGMNAYTATISDSGSTSNVTIMQLLNGSSVNSYQNIGGFVGYSQGTIENSSYSGNVSLTYDISNNSGISIGGFAGFNDRNMSDPSFSVGVINNVINNAMLSFNQANTGIQSNASLTIGGFVGGNRGYISQSGIIGSSSSNPINIQTDVINNSRITVGGFAGANYAGNSTPAGIIENAISTAAITVDQASSAFQQSSYVGAGGFAGQNEAILTNVSSSGKIWVRIDLIDAGINVGGLIGSNDSIAVVTNASTSSAIVINGPGSTLLSPIPVSFAGGQLFVGGLASNSSGAFDNSGYVGATTSSDVVIYADLLPSPTFNLTQVAAGGLFASYFGGDVQSIVNGGNLALNLNLSANTMGLVGGLIGFSLAPVTSFTGNSNLTINGTNDGMLLVGALTGANLGGITTSYVTGSVNVDIANSELLMVGGVAGASINAGFGNPDISNSYSQANLTVRGSNDGGMVGTGGVAGGSGLSNSPLGPLPGGAILNTYNSGAVDVNINTFNAGVTYTGGLVGYLDSTASLTDSFWDTAASGQSIAVGAGFGSVAGGAGGCFDASSCANGGVVDMTQVATYTTGSPYISGAGWDFLTTWGVVDGMSYPYLQAFNPGGAPRYIYGTAPAGNVGDTVNLVVNGVIVASSTISANNTFSFSVANGVIGDGDPFLVYLQNANSKSNLIVAAPNAGGSMSGLQMINDKLDIGDNSAANFTNTSLANLVGALLDDDIFYSASGLDLLLGNASTNMFTWQTSASTNYLFDSSVSTFAGTNVNMIFDGVVATSGTPTISSTGNQIYNNTVTLNGNTTIATTSGGIVFNAGIVGNNNDLTLSVGSTAGTVSLNGNMNNLNNLTVNGSNGANNTLRIDTNNQQQWNITGMNTGNVTGVTGVNGTLEFNGLPNLVGGMNQNTFTFSDGAAVTGVLTAGTLYSNTLDYSAYTDTISVFLGTNRDGRVEDSNGNVITNYNHVGNIIANNQGVLHLPNRANTLQINGAGFGSVNGPVNFSGFNTFYGTARDKVKFNISPYTLDINTGVVIYNDYAMLFIGIPLGQSAVTDLQTIVQATYSSQMSNYDNWTFKMNVSVAENLYDILLEQTALDPKFICAKIKNKQLQICP